jgi:hypothetical protein
MSNRKPSGKPRRKPRIRASSVRWIAAIDRYIRRIDLRGEYLHHAASDKLDGHATREELMDLLRRRFLNLIPHGPSDCFGDGTICGSRWTVALTDRAMRTFWPDRMEPTHDH